MILPGDTLKVVQNKNKKTSLEKLFDYMKYNNFSFQVPYSGPRIRAQRSQNQNFQSVICVSQGML